MDAFIDGRGVRPPVEDDQRARVEIEAAQVTAELAEPFGERVRPALALHLQLDRLPLDRPAPLLVPVISPRNASTFVEEQRQRPRARPRPRREGNAEFDHRPERRATGPVTPGPSQSTVPAARERAARLPKPSRHLPISP